MSSLERIELLHWFVLVVSKPIKRLHDHLWQYLMSRVEPFVQLFTEPSFCSGKFSRKAF